MKRILVGIGLVAVVVGLFLFFRPEPPVPDREKIRQALDGARHGGASHNLGEIMAPVSDRYDDGNYTYSSLRSLVYTGLRTYRHFEVSVGLQDCRVEGDQATATVDVDLSGLTEEGRTVPYHSELAVTFTKVPVRRRLFYQDHTWKIVRIEHLGNLIGTFER